MKRIFWMVALLATVGIGSSFAKAGVSIGPAKVPAYPGLIIREQPDGQTVRTYLRGDEHQHWLMTEDHWQIDENKNGWLKYMKKTRKGSLKLSHRKAHNEEKRTKAEVRWLERHGVRIEGER